MLELHTLAQERIFVPPNTSIQIRRTRRIKLPKVIELSSCILGCCSDFEQTMLPKKKVG